MNTVNVRHFLLAVILSLLTPVALAGGGDKAKYDKDSQAKPIYTMSKIVLNLNHFPSDEEKEKLQTIIDDTDNSNTVRTIAEAIRDMEHQVSGLHRRQLEAIADNEALGEGERTLAEVVAGINHSPDDKAKEKLKNLKEMKKGEKKDMPATR